MNVFFNVMQGLGMGLTVFGLRTGDDRAMFLGMFIAVTFQLAIMNLNLKAIGNNAMKIAEHDTHNLLFKKDQK